MKAKSCISCTAYTFQYKSLNSWENKKNVLNEVISPSSYQFFNQLYSKIVFHFHLHSDHLSYVCE
jgi:hypothetical protein